MISNRQKKLERKRKKRKDRALRLKKIPQNIRTQHVGKSEKDKQDYIKFIEADDFIAPTNDIAEEEKHSEGVDFIGKKKEDIIEQTSDTAELAKDSIDGISTGTLPKKKLSNWEHFKKRFRRKWADSLIEGMFGSVFSIIASVIASIIMIFIGYHFVKNDVDDLKDNLTTKIDQLRTDLSNPESIIRKNINRDLMLERNNNEKQSISDKKDGSNQEGADLTRENLPLTN